MALAGGLQTSAVGRPVERVATVAQALEAARGVDADVVAGPLKGALVDVLARPLVGQQLVALAAAALEAAHGVPAEVVAAPVVGQALVDVFASLPIRLQCESNWAAAPHARGRVLARPVTASVVDRTRLDARATVRVQGVLLVAAARGARVRVLTAVLAASVPIVTG